MRTDTPEVEQWLRRFREGDRETARALVQNIHYVSADEFRAQMSAIIQNQHDPARAIALYAERRVPGPKTNPHRLYKWMRRKVRRAEGVALAPADPDRRHEPDIGSEGIIAQLISDLQTRHPVSFRVHPSMQNLRARRPRKFVLVTDFIGSGDRVRRFLDSAWKVPTLASWASYKLLSFEVISYSATQAGSAAVQQHPTRPTVRTVRGCPTIDLLANPLRDALKAICEDYCPTSPKKAKTPLGYGGTGALMVFAHGAPNNTPLLLHERSRSWEPLFPARTVLSNIPAVDAEEELDETLVALREQQLKHARRLKALQPRERQTFLVLAALKRKPRTVEAVSARTGLTISEVELAVARAGRAGFLGDDLRLTDRAYAEFKYLRRTWKQEPVVPESDDSFYFPTQLRLPVSTFR